MTAATTNVVIPPPHILLALTEAQRALGEASALAMCLPWLRRQADAGATLCAITTGSHFLAEAGLLDNRVATTHWRYFDEFESTFPPVKLQRKRFITRADGSLEQLEYADRAELFAGDQITIETPGGGGFGWDEGDDQ